MKQQYPHLNNDRLTLILNERKAKDADVICPSCGTAVKADALVCSQCEFRFDQKLSGSREEHITRCANAAGFRRVWVSRGTGSLAADCRADYRRKAKRARKLGFASVADRTNKCAQYRSRMLENGWDAETVSIIDTIAGLPPRPNPGRTAEAIRESSGYFDRYHEGYTPQDNDTGRWLPKGQGTQNARRNAEQTIWARPNEREKGREKGKGKDEGKYKGKDKGKEKG